MALIYDKHQSFFIDGLYSLSTHQRIILDVGHLLDRGHNQFLILGFALQLIHQYQGVLRILNGIILASKSTILIKRLNAQFDTIQEEHHLVCIPRVGYELSSLKTRHGLSRASSMPDVSAPVTLLLPIGFLSNVANTGHSMILIGTQHFQCLVFVVSNGIIAY